MKLGIDSFAAVELNDGSTSTPDMRADAIAQLLERVEIADQVGLDTFGIGEHHRPEYLDSASHMILAAAAARTKHIQLISRFVRNQEEDIYYLFPDTIIDERLVIYYKGQACISKKKNIEIPLDVQGLEITKVKRKRMIQKGIKPEGKLIDDN